MIIQEFFAYLKFFRRFLKDQKVEFGKRFINLREDQRQTLFELNKFLLAFSV